MKLWQKGTPTDQKVDHFTVGKDRIYDLVLAPYDCKSSIAHAQMLGNVGLISKEEATLLEDELKAIELSAIN